MKHLSILLLLILSFNVFAKNEKPKVQKKVTSLKPVIDFEPKKIMARATVDKGNKIVEKITITNTGGEGTFKLVFHDYNVDEFGKLDLAKFRAKTPNIKHGMLNWIKYDSNTFTLKHKEVKDVLFEINIPKDAVGSKYAHFTVEPVIERNYVESMPLPADKKKSSFQMKLNIIGLIIVDVVGTGVKKVDLKYVLDEKVNRHGVIATNVGDHYIFNPMVSVLILDKNKKMIERVKLQAEVTQLNPSQKQVWKGLFSKPYSPGEYTAIISMTGDNGNFATSKSEPFSAAGATASKSKKTSSPNKKK